MEQGGDIEKVGNGDMAWLDSSLMYISKKGRAQERGLRQAGELCKAATAENEGKLMRWQRNKNSAHLNHVFA